MYAFDIFCGFELQNIFWIAPRSGLAWKNFIDTGAGVVDEDYRGEVGVLLFNHSDVDFKGILLNIIVVLVMNECD